jgi:acylphosphatase
MKMDYTSFRARVSGLVQGVGFRYFVYREATELSITGFVKNMADGRVEIWAEGPKPLLLEFLASLRVGPRFGRVEDVDLEWFDYEKKYDSFSIKTDYGDY